MSYNTLNYMEQGGATWVVGGTLTVTGTATFSGTTTLSGVNVFTGTNALTGAVTFGSTTTQTDVLATVSGVVNYLRGSSSALTGEHIAVRGRAEAEAAAPATGEVRGIYGQGVINGGLFGGWATGVFGNAIAKATSTSVGIRGGFFEAESEGAPTEIGSLYGTHTRCKTALAPTTNYAVALLETEKFGAGIPSDSFLSFKTTTWAAGDTVADYVVDMGDLVGTVTSVFNLGAVTATNLFEVDADGDGAFTVGVTDITGDQTADAYATVMIGAQAGKILIWY